MKRRHTANFTYHQAWLLGQAVDIALEHIAFYHHDCGADPEGVSVAAEFRRLRRFFPSTEFNE